LSELIQPTLTILVGVIVFVSGQILIKIFIEPVNELMLEIGKVADELIFYSNIYTNPGSNIIPEEKKREASQALRRRATFLIAKASMIKLYWVPSKIGLLPSKKNILEAHGELIFLTNTIFNGDALQNLESGKQIQKLLKLWQT